METELFHSTAYHPQTDGQIERVNQVLEDMLRACVLTYGKKWEIFLPFAEFSYNNSYQASIEMSLFKALYGRRCRTPLKLSESGERAFLGPDLVKEVEEYVLMVRKSLFTAQSRQKSYADRCRCDLVFEMGILSILRCRLLKGFDTFNSEGS